MRAGQLQWLMLAEFAPVGDWLGRRVLADTGTERQDRIDPID